MANKPTLTVFTPTYNRADLLHRGYEALKRQTSKDFLWLIIDDGSADNTREVVEGWMKYDNGFEIRYAYKENGGLHTGYNKAIELMDTEICVCIDSDDWMPDDGVETILSTWQARTIKDVAGIVGLDYIEENKPIGGVLPEVEKCHIYDLDFKYHHCGDKKIVIRVDLFKQVAPQPTYNGEKNFNPMLMIDKIDLNYEWLIINKNLCFVDYQPDGMANGIFRQYLNSPNSFAAMRIEYFKFPGTSLLYKLKQYIHLGSSACLAKNVSWLNKAPRPFVGYMLLPLGYIFSLYIRRRASK